MQHDKGLAQVHQGDARHPLSATITRLIGRASDGGSEGMASRDPADVKPQNGD
ncbi:hypothetical protein SAMN05443248_7986 [Bradyrhizobium erythrophlei]|uniref:Uncharacterized protein n=1 Tax=Bradyrhizobium erythrophlei TaxID=1437360 RepID=A0A1M5Y717_9BRAD|nr:hypothetical protein SAMN05443248_7986 [Bradyrhizobium erythrophlei]